jgi:hypothetical protein
MSVSIAKFGREVERHIPYIGRPSQGDYTISSKDCHFEHCHCVRETWDFVLIEKLQNEQSFREPSGTALSSSRDHISNNFKNTC